jgi:hypothetical protein
MEKKINLEKIFAKVYDCQDLDDLQLEITLNPSLDRLKFAMVEFGKQLLELAAENSECNGFYVYGSADDEERIFNYDLDGLKGIVDGKSILNTINQVE